MIAQYFGMRDDPFGVTPDPRLLYSSHTHREALASLRYSFLAGRGFTALIAEPGMGKTTLLFAFMEQVRGSSHSAFLFNTHLSPEQLLTLLLHELGISPGPTKVEMQEQLYSAVTSYAREGRPLIVLLDEAQCLPQPTLEAVRLLTNFETPRKKLIHVVLAGQPQLAEMLRQPSLLQLRQRIGSICTIERLSDTEVSKYIQHRVRMVGYEGPPIFDDAALGRIAEESRGIPRVINALCFQALSLCCALRKRSVDANIMSEVLRDLELPESRPQLENKQASATLQFTHLDLDEELHLTQRRTGWLVAAIASLVIAIVGAFSVVSGSKAEKPRSVAREASPQAPILTAQVPPKHATDNSRGPSTLLVTVEAQQTLSGIVVSRFGKFDDDLLLRIRTLNPEITNPDFITPGQTIVLPREVHPASNDILSKLMNERTRP